MQRFTRWLLPGLAAFLVVLVVRLPAAWLRPLLPAQLQCAALDGSVWRGSCLGMAIDAAPGQRITADRLDWSLRPLALLTGRLRAGIRLEAAGDRLAGTVTRSAKRLELDDFNGNWPLDTRQLPQLPPGWSGRLQAGALSLSWQQGALSRLQGDLGVQGLQDDSGALLGSYRLGFPPAAGPPFGGELADVDGVLAIRATVQVAAGGQWQVDGRVAPRAATPPGLARELALLGLPAADGSYPFSLAWE